MPASRGPCTPRCCSLVVWALPLHRFVTTAILIVLGAAGFEIARRQIVPRVRGGRPAPPRDGPLRRPGASPHRRLRGGRRARAPRAPARGLPPHRRGVCGGEGPAPAARPGPVGVRARGPRRARARARPTSGARRAAAALKATCGSARYLGTVRSPMYRAYVPQWIGTAVAGRRSAIASAAPSGSRCAPRPRLGPQPQIGMSARSRSGHEPVHLGKEVGVPCEVDAARAEHRVADGRRAGRVGRPRAVVRGERRLDPHGADLEPLPDGELVDVPEALAVQERAEPARDDERRLPAEPLERAEVEMVVVGVREQHRVDPAGRVGVDRHPPSQVGDEHAQQRVGEQADAVERDQDRGVADPPDLRLRAPRIPPPADRRGSPVPSGGPPRSHEGLRSGTGRSQPRLRQSNHARSGR